MKKKPMWQVINEQQAEIVKLTDALASAKSDVRSLTAKVSLADDKANEQRSQLNRQDHALVKLAAIIEAQIVMLRDVPPAQNWNEKPWEKAEPTKEEKLLQHLLDIINCNTSESLYNPLSKFSR